MEPQARSLLVCGLGTIVLLLAWWLFSGGSLSPSTVPPVPEEDESDTGHPTLESGLEAARSGSERIPTGSRVASGLRGFVRRGETGVPGYRVRVLGHAHVSASDTWSVQSQDVLAEAQTEETGAFELKLEPGRYLLVFGGVPRTTILQVSIPSPSDVVLDLDTLAGLRVVVLNSSRSPVSRALVAIRSELGEMRTTLTTNNGSAVVESLAPGTWDVAAAAPGTLLRKFLPMSAIELDPSSEQTVELLLDGATAGRRGPSMHSVRVSVPGQESLHGWRAREMYGPADRWVELGDNPQVNTRRGLEVHAPDGRLWKIRAADEELASGLVEVPVSTEQWRAELVDWHSGTALSGYTVWAHAVDSYNLWAGSKTDESGRFSIAGSRGGSLLLTVYDPRGKKLRGARVRLAGQSRSREGVLRIAFPLPSASGAFAFPSRDLAGTVTMEDGTAPGEGAGIQVSAVFRKGDGVLLLNPPKQPAPLSGSGGYNVEVYESGTYEATVHVRDEGTRRWRKSRFRWEGGPASQRDFVIE